MAHLDSTIKFTGAIGDLVAYQLNGKWVIRRKSAIPKARIKNDPAFERTRESNQEFGGASTIGKQLRQFWQQIILKDKDTSVHHRLNSVLLKMIQQGEGLRGQRTLDWSNAQSNFDGFNINQAIEPHHYLTTLPQVSIQNGQLVCNSVQIGLVTAPKGTTHFKVGILLNALQSYTYNVQKEKYTAASAATEKHTIETPVLAIDEVYSDLTSIATLTTTNWAYSLYIEFYQEINNEYYPLSECPFAWIAIC